MNNGDQPLDKLFVYGTLRKEFDHPAGDILKEKGTYLGNAEYQGRLYLINNYPGVIPSETAEESVHGDLFRLNAVEEVLNVLDRYEGFDESHPGKSHFIRERVQIMLDSDILESWIYLYNRPVDQLFRIDSGDFQHFLKSSDT